MTQKIRLERTLDPKICEKLGMMDLVEYTRHQGWVYLFVGKISMLHKKEVKFYETIEFLEDGVSLNAQIQRKLINLPNE